MTNKRILMICEAFGGGVFAYVSQLCNDLCKSFDIYLAYALRPQTPTNFRDILDKRIQLIEVRNFGGSIFNIKKDIQVIKELRHIANSINPDLIHLHSSVAGGIGRIAFANSKTPVVYTPHGYAHILMGKGGLKLEMYRWMEYILGKTNCITLTCCKSEDEIAKTLSKHTAYIETGVNIEELSAQLDSIQPIKNKKFTVYTLGRTCIQKQPELFNEIAKLVPEARFVWIGGGELDHLLTAPNLELTGWKPRHEALAMGKGADIFILCSLGEAIAMSLIENMYMGKLILVSNVMGNKSVIQTGKNGFICNSAKDYANRIREAMTNYPQEICNQAQKDVQTIYNTHTMTNKYIKFYHSIIKESHK